MKATQPCSFCGKPVDTSVKHRVQDQVWYDEDTSARPDQLVHEECFQRFKERFSDPQVRMGPGVP